VAYDGTDFAGFQVLPKERTVQGVLQNALSKHCKEPIHVYGAGRTDAGVHAEGQVVHFDTESPTPPERYAEAVSRYLPKDVRIVQSREAGPGFHARFSAKSRIYRYAIVPGGRSPLIGRFAWMPRDDPDWEVLTQEASQLIGERDFQRFQTVGDEGTTVRRVLRAEVRRIRNGGFITLKDNAFLRGMVRWVVAALWARALGRMSAEQYDEMLDGRSRPQTLTPAPPQGLCLVGVRYQ